MADDALTGGRPSLYTAELAEAICEEISLGRSLRAVTRDDKYPAMSTVFKWLRENKEFSEQYARACDERAEAHLEEIIEIADDGTNDWMEDKYMKGKTPGWAVNGEAIQRSRLRVDTRKWYMSKMKPKKYGDKVDLTTNGKDLPTPILGFPTPGTDADAGVQDKEPKA